MKPARKRGFLEAFRSGILELLIVLFGLVFVRREVYMAGKFGSMILHWQEYALLFLVFVDGFARGFGELQNQAVFLSPFRRRYLRFLQPVTLFLFVSCSSLCDKLNALCVRAEWWQDLGLVITAAGVLLACWAQITKPGQLEVVVPLGAVEESEAAGIGEEDAPLSERAVAGCEFEVGGPWKILRYPDKSSVLLELLGVSMALSTWMPLLTLPGLFVIFKWELADLEALRVSQFGDRYIEYRKNSWRLIPFFY